jgi:5'-nucleotidase
VIAVALLMLAATGCSSSGSKGSAASTTTSTPAASSSTYPRRLPPAKKLRVLVTNDDGYAAPGIDVMVEALRKMPGVLITVVAPAKNQSGTGSHTTPGTLSATKKTTASGFPATAVDGFPADSVAYALSTVLVAPPDLVVSGINNGQNIGPFTAISGTVGAAKAATVAGIPAIAVSQGVGNPPDFASAARVVISFITSHRSQYSGSSTGKSAVININVPTCTTGALRTVKQVPAATDLSGRDITKVDCASKADAPHDDVDAFLEGFIAVTELDSAGTTVTATTVWAG